MKTVGHAEASLDMSNSYERSGRSYCKGLIILATLWTPKRAEIPATPTKVQGRFVCYAGRPTCCYDDVFEANCLLRVKCEH